MKKQIALFLSSLLVLVNCNSFLDGDSNWENIPIKVGYFDSDPANNYKLELAINFLNEEFGETVYVLDASSPQVTIEISDGFSGKEGETIGTADLGYVNIFVNNCHIMIENGYENYKESCIAHELIHCLGLKQHTRLGIFASGGCNNTELKHKELDQDVRDWFYLMYKNN